MRSASKTRRLAGFRGVVCDGDKGRLCFRGVLLGMFGRARNCSNGRSCSGIRGRASMFVDGRDVDGDQRTADITLASRAERVRRKKLLVTTTITTNTSHTP